MIDSADLRFMKTTFTASILVAILSVSSFSMAQLGKKPETPPHWLAPIPDIEAPKVKKKKVKPTHTVEISRIAFTKWEEHCCGIKIKGNYMRVTYQTFFCDGSSKVWVKEFRS